MEKISPRKLCSKRLVGVLIVLMTLFLINFSSAAEWDNVYSYNEETKTATIENWFGLGADLAYVTLTSPSNVMVARGNDRLVGQFNFTTTGDFQDTFGDIYLEDVRSGNEISRGKQFKYKKYTNISVDDYETTCENITSINGTSYRNCTRTEIGNHWEVQMDWMPIINPTNTFYEGITYEIGVFVDVEVDDYGDWIPSIMGVEIEEWATWTEDLNVGLVSYWKLDGTSGDVLDSVGVNNGTNSGSTRGQIGIINNSFSFGGSDFIDITGINSTTQDHTFNVWVNSSAALSGSDYFIDSESGRLILAWTKSTISNNLGFYDGTWRDFEVAPPNDGDWHMITIVLSETGGKGILYIDSVKQAAEPTYLGTTIGGTTRFFNGFDNTASGYEGLADEIGLWNRTLDQSEVTQLYNGGSGITWTEILGVAPSVTLTSPVDNANITQAEIDFIATVTDDEQVVNVTLYIDGVINETNSSGFNGSYTFSKVIAEGIHNWSILAYNNVPLSNQSETRTFNYTQPPIDIQLNNPADAFVSVIPLVNMSCSASDGIGVEQLNLTIDGIVNETLLNSSVAENLTINKEINFSEGIYIWGCQALNVIDTSSSANRTLNVTYSLPVITLISPADNSNTTEEEVIFNFTATDTNGINDVSIFINGVLNETNSSGVSGSYNFNITLVEGFYNWSISATSIVGKQTNSSNRSLIVHTTTPNASIFTPSGILGYFLLGANETLTYNFSETGQNLSEHLEECWYVYPSASPLIDGRFCVQETANISTACGGLDTGNYSWSLISNWDNPTNMMDGNWDTWGKWGIAGPGSVSFYINYTIPERSNNATWKWKFERDVSPSSRYWCLNTSGNWSQSTLLDTGAGAFNSSLVVNPDCLLNDTLQIRVVSLDEEKFYEEAIYWDLSNDLNCTSNTTTFLYEEGLNNITIYARDIFGFIASASSNWIYTLLETNQTYPTTSVETATETYTANVSYSSTDYSVITAILNFNEYQYLGTKTSTGDSAMFSTNVIMPTVTNETNKTAYWTISLTNITSTIDYNLTSHNVTIGPVNLSLCDATNNVSFWNFTVYNESNLVEINSTFEATFAFRIQGSTENNYFSFEDLTGLNSQFDFCISPGTENYTADTSIKLTKTGYVDKFYDYQEVSLTNSTRTDSLYMMATGDSTSFIVHVVYVDSSDVIGVEVRVQRYYQGLGDWLTTEILTTNYVGEAVGHLLAEDADYRFLVYESGISIHNSSSTKITCTVSPCTVTLVLPIIIPTEIETVEDLTSTLTYSGTTNIFTYTYSDTSGDFSSARLNILKVFPSDATLIFPCNETKTSSIGVMTCDITGQINGTYRATGYITRNAGEFLDKRIDGILGNNIYNSMGEDGVLWSIFLLIAIIMLGVSRPSLAIIFGTIGLITIGLLQMINLGALSIVAISAIAIILLMRIGKE